MYPSPRCRHCSFFPLCFASCVLHVLFIHSHLILVKISHSQSSSESQTIDRKKRRINRNEAEQKLLPDRYERGEAGREEVCAGRKPMYNALILRVCVLYCCLSSIHARSKQMRPVCLPICFIVYKRFFFHSGAMSTFFLLFVYLWFIYILFTVIQNSYTIQTVIH